MSALLTILIVHVLGMISPGPDFLLVTRNGLKYSRRIAVFTALGVACGIGVHVTYSLLGLGLIISQSILLFNTVKLLGAGYLMFIGIKALIYSRSKSDSATEKHSKQTHEISAWQSFRMGFLCNVLNPKATLAMFGLFTLVMDPHTPGMVQMGYGVMIVSVTAMWFSFVALMVSRDTIKNMFRRAQTSIERTMGVILVALGLKIAFSNSK